MKLYGCDPEVRISQLVQTDLKLADGTGKPQRQMDAAYTLPNNTVSSTDSVNYRWGTCNMLLVSMPNILFIRSLLTWVFAMCLFSHRTY